MVDLTGYRLTFSDDFSAFQSSPDGGPGKWATTAFGIRTLPANGEREFYSDTSVGVNPFSVSNGALTITAAPGSNPLGLPYNSGEITSRGMFSQTYGYFEMRAQLPTGAGMWPAFWLMPADGGAGEIDIMEAFGKANGGQGDANSYSVAVHDPAGGGQEWVNTGANTQTGYHTYGVDWQPDKLTFYFDGAAVKTMPTPADMNRPFYAIANLAVGGDWVGQPAGETAQMKLDYIRAYTKDASPMATGPVYIKPGSGTFTDAAGHVYSIDPSGNAMEDNQPIPGGGGTSQMALYLGTVLGQDSGSRSWYSWNQQFWTSTTAPPTGTDPPPSTGGTGPAVPPAPDVLPTPTGLRDPSQIPFASDSVFNKPLGSGATWQANAQLDAARVYINTAGNFNEPIYKGGASDTLVTVTNTGASGGTPGTFQVHIPAAALAAVGTDHSLSVDDTVTHTWFGFSGFERTGTSTATVSQGSGEPDFGSGIQVAGSNWDQGVGTLRASDLAAGVISHMLRIEIPSTMAMSWSKISTDILAPYAWPQTSEDGFANNGQGGIPYSGTVLYGVTIGIPANAVEPAAVKADPGANMLWHELHEHGAMVRDTTGTNNADGITLQTDNDVSGSNPLIQGMIAHGAEIMAQTAILTNQGPNSINGGGTPIVALDGPLTDDTNADGIADTPAPPPPPPPPAAQDTLTVVLSEDRYKGDAQYAVKVDGKQVGTGTVEAIHSQGQTDSFDFLGSYAIGPHTVEIDFLNDLYRGTPSTDRNLYVEDVKYNGISFLSHETPMLSAGATTYTVQDKTA